MFWLPLVAHAQSTELAAPLDIAWVWYVHMLCPQQYERDCLSVVNVLVDHKLMTRSNRQKALHKTSKVWHSRYPAEPFEVDLKSPPATVPDYSPKISYNLEAAAGRQSAFYYQVSLPHYRDMRFLKKALERYEYHLKLKKLHPDYFLVPCYDIDLVWHAHQAHPLTYKNDTKALLGHVFNHDDTTTDRTPGSLLSTADQATRTLWNQYGLHFGVDGAMYRGENPLPRPPVPPGTYHGVAAKQYEISLLSVQVENLDPLKKFKVKLYVDSSETVFKGTTKDASTTFSKGVKPLCNFLFSTDRNRDLRVKVARSGVFSSGNVLVNNTFNFVNYVTNTAITKTGSQPFTHDFELQGGVKIQLTTKIAKPPNVLGYIFKVNPQQQFTEIQHPSLVVSYPKLFLSPAALALSNVPCEMSIHQVVDNIQREAFSCRVVHAAQLRFSSVEVINIYGQVVASSHLIDREVLPQRAQLVDRKCCSLEAHEGERAMLIRGREDWGILLGKWVGYKRSRTRGKSGFLQLSFYSLHGDVGTANVFRKPKSFKYSVGTVYDPHGSNKARLPVDVDLASGQIKIPATMEDVPEALALGMSVAMLFVLCQPYVPQIANVAGAPAMSKARLSNRPRGFINDDLSLIIAAGYFAHTVPTNSFYYHHLGMTYGVAGDYCDAPGCDGGCGGCAAGDGACASCGGDGGG